MMIEKYRKEYYSISLPLPISAIKKSMEINGLKDKDLILIIGSKTSTNLVLNRKRTLNIDMFRNLTSSSDNQKGS
jgi:HTH-type transcriptional regulator/antitoxin HigA